MRKANRWDVLCVAILLIMAISFLFPVVMGGRLITGDHSAHFYKAWNLENNLLPRGRLYDWSNLWFAGYPVNYTYPFGVDLLVVAIHKLSFGLLTLDNAYALAVFFAYVMIGLSVYIFTSALINRKVGFLAAFLMMTDKGVHPYGGWSGTIWLGVWPCALGGAITMLTIYRLFKLIEKHTLRNAGFFALFCGLALLIHPFQLINLAICATVLMVSCLLTQKPIFTLSLLKYLAPGGIVALCIGSLLLIPYLGTADYDYIIGENWYPLHTLLALLFDNPNEVFTKSYFVTVLFSLLGVVLLLLDKRPAYFYCGLIFPVFLVVIADDVGGAMMRYWTPKMAEHIEFPRFVMLMKPYMLIASAFAMVAVGEWLYEKLASRVKEILKIQNTYRRGGQLVVLSLIALAPISKFAVEFINQPSSMRGWLQLASQLPERPYHEQFIQWANAQASQENKFYRIAVDLDPNPYHEALDLSTRVKTPLLNLGFTPSLLFRDMPHTSFRAPMNYPLFNDTNVRYLLTNTHIDDKANLTLVVSFGPLLVYEYTHWHPDFVSVRYAESPTQEVSDPAISIEKWENDQLIVNSQSEKTGVLVAHMSYFPRWSATLDDKPITITQLPLEQFYAQAVPLHAGRYVFTFMPSLAERLAPLICLLGLIGSAVMIFSNHLFARKGPKP